MKLYEQYIKDRFDLSAFGIEKGERRSDYFCTPKGAKILGWTGVDGIHYCVIGSLGETVFAIQPMGDYGRHVFPVAKSFDDFLRLLMACGHEAYLEQAHAWTRERYDAYAAENPISDEAGEGIRYFREQYRLTPMPDPYEYLKAIYEGFDYGSIPYKAGYHEMFPDEAYAAKAPKEWRVYFSLGGKGVGSERAGAEIPIGASFFWNGCEWYIPSAYSCAKGLVLDLFAEVNKEAADRFFDTWDWIREYGSPEEIEAWQAKDPMTMDFEVSATVNGRPMAQGAALGATHVRGRNEHQWELADEAIAHYGIDAEKYLIWRRVSFPWATKAKPAIKSLCLRLVSRPSAVYGMRFCVQGSGEEIVFTHPITGKEHRLTVCTYEDHELRWGNAPTASPVYFTEMNYTLSPELSGHQLQISDREKSVVGGHPTPDKAGSDFESAIAVIGGADGPTAVCVGAKQGTPEIHAVCSSLRSSQHTQITWQMIFREKTTEDLHVMLISENPAVRS